MTNEQKLYIHTDYIWHLNHPITPPPELVLQWLEDAPEDGELGISKHIATQAARWGSDQELEACCDWFQEFYKTESWVKHDLKHFRHARRPEPPSLKEQALEALEALPKFAIQENTDFICVIRRALESLAD